MKRKNIISLGLSALLVAGIFLMSGTVSAYSVPTYGLPQATLSTSSIAEMLQLVITWVFLVVTGIAIIMILVGAIMWMTSGGDSGRVGTARSLIIYALIGFAIALLARAIVNWVATTFLQVS